LINVLLPHFNFIESGILENAKVGILLFDVDGKPVDFNGMEAVIVKCIDCLWTAGSESD